MDKVQIIREEVARIQLYTQSEVLKQVLDYIDEVQKEPVSEELEEASKNYALNNTPWDDCKDEIQESFKAGAQWQKQQDQATIEIAEDHAMLAGMEKMEEEMIEKAINGYVIEDIEEGNGDFLLSAEYLPKSMGLKDRQKVKVIVIKVD